MYKVAITIVQIDMTIIRFNRESKFLAPIESALRQRKSDLESGQFVRVFIQEEERGYEREVTARLDPSNPIEFVIDLEMNDPTRFGARLRAAATALRNTDNFGRYLISHFDGTISIKKL